jgi:hypothetical protein
MARRILPRPFLGLRHQSFLPSLSIASRWTCWQITASRRICLRWLSTTPLRAAWAVVVALNLRTDSWVLIGMWSKTFQAILIFRRDEERSCKCKGNDLGWETGLGLWILSLAIVHWAANGAVYCRKIENICVRPRGSAYSLANSVAKGT